MYFTNSDGEVIRMSHIVSVEPVIEGRYSVNMSGGHHVTITESFKPRSVFISEWTI